MRWDAVPCTKYRGRGTYVCGCIVYLKAYNACKAIICYLDPPVSNYVCRGVSQVDSNVLLVHRCVISIQLILYVISPRSVLINNVFDSSIAKTTGNYSKLFGSSIQKSVSSAHDPSCSLYDGSESDFISFALKIYVYLTDRARPFSHNIQQ